MGALVYHGPGQQAWEEVPYPVVVTRAEEAGQEEAG